MITLFAVAVVPLVPTEPVLIGMAVLASSHTIPLGWVIAVAAVGCSLSDHILYATGRFAGGRLLDRVSSRPSVRAATDWLTRNVTRWGSTVLVVGRWLPAGGTVGAVLAGTLRWRLRRFTPASVIGSTLWSTYVALVGYFGGSLTGEPLVGFAVSLAVAALVGLAGRAWLGHLTAAHRGQENAAEGPADDQLEPSGATSPG